MYIVTSIMLPVHGNLVSLAIILLSIYFKERNFKKTVVLNNGCLKCLILNILQYKGFSFL